MLQVEQDRSSMERLSRLCNKAAEKALLVLGLTMAVVVICQVFSRYVLNHSLFWSEELARYLLVWLSFFGASVAYYRNAHPSMDLLYARIPVSSQRLSRIVVHLLCLVFFLLMLWYGCAFALFVKNQTTPALSLPKWTIFSIIPASGMIMAIHATAKLYREILFGGKKR